MEDDVDLWKVAGYSCLSWFGAALLSPLFALFGADYAVGATVVCGLLAGVMAEGAGRNEAALKKVRAELDELRKKYST